MKNLSQTKSSFGIMFLLAVLTGVLVTPLRTKAQTPPEHSPCADRQPHVNPANQTCETSGATSQCWFVWGDPNPNALTSRLFPIRPGQSAGFPLNIDLTFGNAIPEFGPLSWNAAASALPLVPSEAGLWTSPVGKVDRPVLDGVVDLVTGGQLLREVDFELPFGGATFRHVRTRRSSSTFMESPHDQGKDWDWNGGGWMIGESPLLLIDSWNPAYMQEGERRCELMLDAHHSISFTRNPDGTYEAAPRYNAKISHDGDWDTNHWEAIPKHFYIWLDGGALKYTFDVAWHSETGNNGSVAVFDDIFRHTDSQTPPNDHLSSAVNPNCIENAGTPGGPIVGWGRPGYAFCSEIRDRAGNRVEIEFGGRSSSAGPTSIATTTDTTDWTERYLDLECQPCLQGCAEKGQVKWVKLYPAGQSVPEWTLIYTHREFLNWAAFGYFWNDDASYNLRDPLAYEKSAYHHAFNQHMLASIHVYRTPRDQGVLQDALNTTGLQNHTLKATLFAYKNGDLTQPISDLEDIDEVNILQARNLPSNVEPEFEVRYVYTEMTMDHNFLDVAGPKYSASEDVPLRLRNLVQFWTCNGFGTFEAPGVPALVKTTVLRKTDSAVNSGESIKPSQDITLYSYRSNVIPASVTNTVGAIIRPKSFADLWVIQLGVSGATPIRATPNAILQSDHNW